MYGVQFHPEVMHTIEGHKIIKNFLFHICNVIDNWNSKNFVKDTIQNIKQETKGKKVLCALSGGVDSTVVAVLLSKAIGAKVVGLHLGKALLGFGG